jgi:DNA-binding PadR family transcriptional regulator
LVDRRGWLLAFIAAPADNARFLTDQIRIMKGLFLLSKEGPADLRDLYAFEPYDYGPFDKQVYKDLDALEQMGLIASERVPGSNRRSFRTTPQGDHRFDEIRASAKPETLAAVDQAKALVCSMGFMRLLRYVYERHPDFAVSSIVNR